jgi:hypothetical protein
MRGWGLGASTGSWVKAENLITRRPINAHGVPADLEACHTARVAGQVVEGHLPADVVARLRQARPEAVGLVVTGMAIGSLRIPTPRLRPPDALTGS